MIPIVTENIAKAYYMILNEAFKKILRDRTVAHT